MRTFLIALTFLTGTITAVAQVSYSGVLHSESQGLSADVGIKITGSIGAGGIEFDQSVTSFKIKSLTAGNKTIPVSQMPADVVSKITNDVRPTASYDIFVNGKLLKRYGVNTAISWATLLGLPDSEGYKQSTKNTGKQLFNSGAISIRNVQIQSYSCYYCGVYINQLGEQAAKAGTTASTSKSAASNSAASGSSSSEVLINNSSNSNAAAASNPLAGATSQSKFERDLEKGQVISDVANGILDMFKESDLDKENRRLAAQQQTAAQNLAMEKEKNVFKEKVAKYRDRADGGDENVQLFLIAILESYKWEQKYYFDDVLPQWKKWLSDAIKNNNAEAMTMVGIFTLNDYNNSRSRMGVANTETAVQLLEKAAAFGNTDAMFLVGFYYYDNNKSCIYSTSKGGGDAVKALKYISDAADAGMPIANEVMGIIYLHRETSPKAPCRVNYDVKKNPVLAHAYLTRSRDKEFTSKYIRGYSWDVIASFYKFYSVDSELAALAKKGITSNANTIPVDDKTAALAKIEALRAEAIALMEQENYLEAYKKYCTLVDETNPKTSTYYYSDSYYIGYTAYVYNKGLEETVDVKMLQRAIDNFNNAAEHLKETTAFYYTARCYQLLPDNAETRSQILKNFKSYIEAISQKHETASDPIHIEKIKIAEDYIKTFD